MKKSVQDALPPQNEPCRVHCAGPQRREVKGPSGAAGHGAARTVLDFVLGQVGDGRGRSGTSPIDNGD
jgi:hypothetical protein